MTATATGHGTDAIFAESVARLLDRSCPYRRIAELESGPTGYDTELWATMTGLGWTSFFASETGFDRARLPELSLLLGELGRRAVAVPLLQTAIATLFADSPIRTEAGRRVLRDIERGDGVTVAIGADLGTRVRAHPDGDGLRLASPTLPPAEWLATADTAVVPLYVTVGKRPGVLPVALAVQEHKQLRLSNIGALDNERVAQAVFVGEPVIGPEAWLTDAPLSVRRWRSVLLLACLLRATEMVGIGRGMMELVLEHVKRREVFGKPLARFQAVQHMCADAATRLRSSALLTAEAVELASQGRAFERHAATAIYCTGRAVTDLALTAAQLHGGIGFTAEFPLNVYFRRAKAQQMRGGRLTEQLDEIGRWLPRPGNWWALKFITTHT
jgi:3-oxocholest-4-en-26-oyl-CoA dehydrogenase beta subunit